MKLNTIYNESCVKTMEKMPDNIIDLVVTSPPYDHMREYDGNFTFSFKTIAKSLFRVMKLRGVVVWVVGDQTIKGDETGSSFKQALYFKSIGFNLFDTMIYLKPPRGAVGNNKTYWQSFEYMFVLSKGLPKTINLIRDRENKESRRGDNGTKRLPNGSLLKLSRGGYTKMGRRTNVWEYNTGKGHSATDRIAHKHPAIFPEKLAEDHILSWSNPNDLVYDPFLGSGTTSYMALKNDRKWLGSEINEDYCLLAEQRMNKNLINTEG
ncbi:MAG: site-specific DNA-methyltransferase [Flavobacteriaceae bacterium]|nr:site-specific DNA-methyltransferase [Flavobacteriaceae bacterium]